jgi:hypothetical protein
VACSRPERLGLPRAERWRRCTAGALLGLRKLLRKGARQLDKPNDPWWLDKGHGSARQFNVQGMWQEVEDLSDSFAQELGLALVVIGTVISAAGAPLMQLVAPLGA